MNLEVYTSQVDLYARAKVKAQIELKIEQNTWSSQVTKTAKKSRKKELNARSKSKRIPYYWVRNFLPYTRGSTFYNHFIFSGGSSS